jgi:hypothetical protein
MEIKFRNDYWDIIRFHVYALPRATTYRVLWFLLFGFTCFMGFASSGAQDATSLLERIIIAAVDSGFHLVVISIAVVPVLFVVSLSAYLFNRRDRIKDCTLTIMSDGISVESPSTRTEIKWLGIRKIATTNRYLFIFISDTAAIVVPYRAFTEPSKGKQFYNSIIELWKANKEKSRV